MNSLGKSTATTETGFKMNYCSLRRHAETLEGEGKAFGEAEADETGVSKLKIQATRKKPTTIPLCRGRASRRKWHRPIAIQNRTKYTTRNNLCPPEREPTKITFGKGSHPSPSVLCELKVDFYEDG